jgi:hypothetical protein
MVLKILLVGVQNPLPSMTYRKSGQELASRVTAQFVLPLQRPALESFGRYLWPNDKGFQKARMGEQIVQHNVRISGQKIRRVKVPLITQR